MKLAVRPAHLIKGAVELPPSKSYSIRSIIIAACGGSSRIRHCSRCADAWAAVKAARRLGASVKFLGKNDIFIKADLDLEKKLVLKINVFESGTVLRFLLPLLALRNSSSEVRGSGTLIGRPNKFLAQTLRQMGRDVRGRGAQESVPVTVGKGMLKGGNITIDGSLSSQFVSALLIACPLLKEKTYLAVTGSEIVSAPYIEMTLAILKQAGIKIRKVGRAQYLISGQQVFKGLRNFTVPSDYGLAAFLLAAAALTKSHVVVSGFFDNRLVQADGAILKFLKQMGVKIEAKKTFLKVKGPFVLQGGNFSLKNCPDLVPIMAVLALFAKGKTRLYGIGHARAKESDRISDLRRELVKIGARITEKKDEIVIYPQPCYKQNILLDPHHDHRLAMAFSVLGLKCGVQIKDIECTAKSYPRFVSDLKKIGVSAIKSA